MKRLGIFLFLLLLLVSWGAHAQEMVTLKRVSPLDFGLREAQSGEERYNILYQAHTEAVKRHLPLDYTGIDTLFLDIPEGAKSIPLPPQIDFRGLVLFVRNNAQHLTLFSLAQSAQPIEISKEQVASGNFTDIPELAQGTRLLILSDKNPWVAERIGYGSPAMRRDLLYLREGIAQNAPVAPWNTPATDMQCSYCAVDTATKRIQNLTIHRDIHSSFKTYAFYISCQDNVKISNITVTTPKSKLLADGIFSISNSSHIELEDVTIDGTYSKAGVSTGYGYAFSLNNLYNTTFRHVVADGNWGVFGSNCLNMTTLEECDLNRFDIHCYGRDASCRRCTFRNKQTQFSSMFGTVLFDSCTFIDCIPLRIRSSYNAYTPFDVRFVDCTFHPTRRYHALVNLMLLDTNNNSRPELSEKNIPNITIENLTVNMPAGLQKIILIDPTGTTRECTQRRWGYLSNITLNNVKTLRKNKPSSTKIYLSSRPITTANIVDIQLLNIQNNKAPVVTNIIDKN